MHIDSYQFGKIVIDGTAYNLDCLILCNSVQANWWRKQGHLLTPEDLEPVITARPSILVIGCGASGLMKVSEEIGHILQEHDIELFNQYNFSIDFRKSILVYYLTIEIAFSSLSC
jgi:hypothetical protein